MVLGKKGDYYGLFSAATLHQIKALALQEPATSRVVPNVNYIYCDTVNALVDFHEGKYNFPDKYGVLAHQVMAADLLGDDTFIAFVAESLKVPHTRLDISHNSHTIRKTVRDRLRLKDTFSSINDIPQNVCYKCRREFLQQDVLVKVGCCSRQYHRRCLLGVASCPFCTVAWCGLQCAKCGGHTMQRDELEPHRMLERRRSNRMACCGVDIHPHCKKWLTSCPGCGVSPSQRTAEIFVYLRRLTRGNEAKRRAICLSRCL